MIVTIPTLSCPRCHATWHPRIASPKRCPTCFYLLAGRAARPAFPLTVDPTLTTVLVATLNGIMFEETSDCPVIRPE